VLIEFDLEEQCLLNKCANLDCGESFRYLQQGKLFRVEKVTRDGSSEVEHPEYFWLCQECSEKVSLRLDGNAKVTAVALSDRESRNTAEALFLPLDRKEGVLLSYFQLLPAAGPHSEELRRRAAYAA